MTHEAQTHYRLRPIGRGQVHMAIRFEKPKDL